MFPCRSRVFCAPFCDAVLYADVSARSAFWENSEFYGVNLRAVASEAADEAFKQPIIGTPERQARTPRGKPSSEAAEIPPSVRRACRLRRPLFSYGRSEECRF